MTPSDAALPNIQLPGNISALSKTCKYASTFGWIYWVNEKQFSHLKLFWDEDCHVWGLTSWKCQLLCLIYVVLNRLLSLSPWLGNKFIPLLSWNVLIKNNPTHVQCGDRWPDKWQDELLKYFSQCLWNSRMYTTQTPGISISCRSNKTSTCIKFSYLRVI